MPFGSGIPLKEPKKFSVVPNGFSQPASEKLYVTVAAEAGVEHHSNGMQTNIAAAMLQFFEVFIPLSLLPYKATICGGFSQARFDKMRE
ncbi:MAG TPA: hypothetical protein VLW65_03100 [Bryobacteraceae bacterium]|nr:hypothetical protein [Bryobacteraceae bacterium]